jgi:transcriptional regulator with XRE-family HTH domain
MIRNEREFRVTQAARDRLLLERSAGDDTPEWVQNATRQAVASEVLRLDAELADYRALWEGHADPVTEIHTLADLPRALIRSRIASRLTQQELAERLGLRAQQIQRYEANDYAGASIARLSAVMEALGVSLAGEMNLPLSGTRAKVQKTLAQLGMDRETAARRFVGEGPEGPTRSGWMGAAARAARVFGTTVEDILNGTVALPVSAAAFRATSVADVGKVSAYAVYAEFLAQTLATACDREYRPLPPADEIRDLVGSQLSVAPFEALLDLCWDHGIPVLPLSDRGAFFGACWHFEDRPVIALKNRVRSVDRWSFLLAHEMDHAGNPEQLSVLESDLTAAEWREQPDEIRADQYASEILLGPNAEAMVRVAVNRADGDVARLKAVVPSVAEAGGVRAGVLADHIAFRLGSQEINWWATAMALHDGDPDPWLVARSKLFDHIDLASIDGIDRDILIDGLAP